ncbi:conjugal transfer protein TraN [Cupriavidus sp. YAF13]|uniref:conjugal transfer protein TraN n=1 Tax=Cupriavidus sp. YAF13 TaxID=3233075 RepID=UPI003F91ADE2
MNCLLRGMLGALLSAILFQAWAGDCRKTAEYCVDSGTKYVSGYAVHRDCWRYESRFTCEVSSPANYCSAIAAIPGCFQVGSECTQVGSSGACIRYADTYRCGQSVAPPAGVVQLDNTYTVSTDIIDRSQCESVEANKSCQRSERVCVEPGGTRVINGLSVTKDCWQWEERYACITQDYKNYCEPLKNKADCKEVARTCTSQAWDGSCNAYQVDYNCDAKAGEPLPEHVAHLDSSYTIINDLIDKSQCEQYANNRNCTFAGRRCTDPGGTRNINGLDVTKDCWAWTDDYVCADTTLKSDCGDLKENKACALSSSNCLDTLPAGQCGLREHLYTCLTQAEQTTDRQVCGDQICVGGRCETHIPAADRDFGRVISGLEAQRQVGMYLDPATLKIFGGEKSSCTKKIGGMVDCCKATTKGGNSSNSMMNQAARTGVKYIAGEAVKTVGSAYLFDALSSTGMGTNALNFFGITKGYSFGDTPFSFYGVSWSPMTGFAFDPYSLAFQVAIQVVTQYMQCKEDDNLLAMRKGQGLCTRVGSYCGSKQLGVCLEKKEGYCCFNSKLSRIINEQGRPQLGKGWGDPANPDCSGFLIDEFTQLDFGTMNLEEFYQDVIPKDQDKGAIVDRMHKRTRTAVQRPSSKP